MDRGRERGEEGLEKKWKEEDLEKRRTTRKGRKRKEIERRTNSSNRE